MDPNLPVYAPAPSYQSPAYQPQVSAIPVPGPGGALMSGFQGGMNMGAQLRDSWRNNRAASDRAAQTAAVGAQGHIGLGGEAPAAPAQSPGFFGGIKNGVEGFANNVLGTHFGSAAPAVAPALPSAAGAKPGFFSNLASMLHMEEGGPVPSYMPVNAAPVPGPGGALMSGFQGGMSMGSQLRDTIHNNREAADRAAAVDAVGQQAERTTKDHLEDFATALHGFTLNDAHVPNSQQAVAPPVSPPVPSSPVTSAAPPAGPPAAGGAAPSAAPPGPGAPSPAAPTAGASSPPPGPAIPPGLANASPEQKQGTTMALQSAAADPASQQGVPQQAPPHSMSHVDMDLLNRLKYKAAASAARAGHDPEAVLRSMDAVQTSMIQGGIMKNLQAANVAIMSGNQPAVEQALRNVNYYLPNGQDLNMKKDPTTGQLQYHDPFATKNSAGQYVDPATGKPTTDGQPPLINVDAAHIQMLAANAVDPSKVQDIINAAHTQGAKIAHEHAQDVAGLFTAQGHLLTGQARARNAETNAGIADSTKYRNIGMTDAAITRAGAEASRAATAGLQKGTVPFAAAEKASTEGSTAVFNLAQGQPETVPVVDAAGNPSLSPAAGKAVRNPDKIPAWLRDDKGKPLDTTTVTAIAALAGKLNAANIGRTSAPESAETAARIIKLTHGKMTTHTGADGKPKPDFMVGADGTTGWLWQPGASKNSGSWKQFKMQAETGAMFASGVDQVSPFADAGGGGAPGEDNYDAEDAADNAPAIEPPSQ